MNTYEYTNTGGEARKFVGDKITIAGTIVTIDLSGNQVAFINLAPGDFIKTLTPKT